MVGEIPWSGNSSVAGGSKSNHRPGCGSALESFFLESKDDSLPTKSKKSGFLCDMEKSECQGVGGVGIHFGDPRRD